ncbi:hypothetical protein CGRA01v4_09847 [Colletotrichum graminicola]|nr:hypothetical protein CGRA01v4_09847 [Colletotrichum graminicola]
MGQTWIKEKRESERGPLAMRGSLLFLFFIFQRPLGTHAQRMEDVPRLLLFFALARRSGQKDQGGVVGRWWLSGKSGCEESPLIRGEAGQICNDRIAEGGGERKGEGKD